VNGSGFLDPSETDPTPSDAVTLDGGTPDSAEWHHDRVIIRVSGLAAGDHTIVVHDWLGGAPPNRKSRAQTS